MLLGKDWEVGKGWDEGVWGVRERERDPRERASRSCVVCICCCVRCQKTKELPPWTHHQTYSTQTLPVNAAHEARPWYTVSFVFIWRMLRKSEQKSSGSGSSCGRLWITLPACAVLLLTNPTHLARGSEIGRQLHLDPAETWSVYQPRSDPDLWREMSEPEWQGLVKLVWKNATAHAIHLGCRFTTASWGQSSTVTYIKIEHELLRSRNSVVGRWHLLHLKNKKHSLLV